MYRRCPSEKHDRHAAGLQGSFESRTVVDAHETLRRDRTSDRARRSEFAMSSLLTTATLLACAQNAFLRDDRFNIAGITRVDS